LEQNQIQFLKQLNYGIIPKSSVSFSSRLF
jgi:hypothetical protein